MATLNFGISNGGTLTAGSFYGSPSQIQGTGTINANGLVSDLPLVFNSPASVASQAISLVNSTGTTTLNLAPLSGVFGALVRDIWATAR